MAQRKKRVTTRATAWMRVLLFTAIATAVFACDAPVAPQSPPDAPPMPKVNATLSSGMRNAVYSYTGKPQPVFQHDAPSSARAAVLTT